VGGVEKGERYQNDPEEVAGHARKKYLAEGIALLRKKKMPSSHPTKE